MNTDPKASEIAPMPEEDRGATLAAAIDALSLNQALVDFEMANARVLDLTARLVEAQQRMRSYANDADAIRQQVQAVSDERDRVGIELEQLRSQLHTQLGAAATTEASLRSELERINAELHQARVDAARAHEQMAELRRSRTFRVASKLGALKRLLR